LKQWGCGKLQEQKQDKYFPDFSKSCLLQSMVMQQLQVKVFL
jgi:hypothetical protein